MLFHLTRPIVPLPATATRFASNALSWALLLGLFAAPRLASATGSSTSSIDVFSVGFTQRPTVIEAIEILGNERTARNVILQRLTVRPGDLVDEDRLQETRLRLLGTGYFHTVEMRLERGSARGFVVLSIEVVERNTVLVDDIYFGFSDVAPIFLGFGLSDRNFLGEGVALGAHFVVGQDRRALQLKFFLPSLSETRLQLSSSLILLRGAELITSQDPTNGQLDYERFGGTFGLGIGVGPAQRITLIYRIESISAGELPDVDPVILRQAPQIQFGDSLVSSISLQYERDTRDDPFVATEGTRLRVQAEVATSLLGSSYDFSKYTAEAQSAFRLFRDHSLSLRIFGGFIQGRAPFFDQFFLRDFTHFILDEQALPRNVDLNFSVSNDYDDVIISAGLDYSVPVFRGHSILYRLYVYSSITVGASASLDELQADPNGRGAGGRFPLSFDVGLKFDTSFGNLRLSTAYIMDLIL
jgi:outer membrane protein insertion porin family